MHTTLAKRILCYGDSITRGRIPAEKGRYASNTRRTGVMQLGLGQGYEVIEEGVRGRYTNHDNDKIRGRNGMPYFYPCILSNLPIDILIIFLGTNNFQTQFSDTPEQIVGSIELYKADLEAACKEFIMPIPKVVLISPPYIDSSLLDDDSKFDTQSEATSKILKDSYQAFAEKNDRGFFDAASIVGYGVVDGIHLSAEQNIGLGKALAEYIQSI